MGRSPRRVRRRLVAVASAVVVLAVTLALPAAHAGFSAVTDNPGDVWATDRLAPPSGLSASQTCSPAPTIAFRAAATASGTGSVTVGVPAGTVRGDLLVAQVAHLGSATTLAVPSGWTLIRSDTSGTAVTSALYWKAATGAEPGATFALPAGSTLRMAGGIAAYSGVRTAAPVDAHDGVAGNGLTPYTPAVTTTTADTVLVRLITNASTSFPEPAGTTLRWRFTMGGGSTAGLTASDEPFAGPGAAPRRDSVAQSSTASSGIGQTVALRHAPGTPSAVLSWTPSPSTWATGHVLERSTGGSVQSTRTVTPAGTASTTEGPLVNGVPYAFRLWAYRGTWVSTAVTTTLTPSC